MNETNINNNETERHMEAQFNAIADSVRTQAPVTAELKDGPEPEQDRGSNSSDSYDGEPVYITPPPVEPQVIYGGPPLEGAPPTYSGIMRIGPSYTDPPDPPDPAPRPPVIRVQPSPPFIAPPPPPSYAVAQGLYMDLPTVPSLDPTMFGPDPISVICPRCAAIVITRTRTTQSNLTHISALTLCMCGCWPCCLLPYCMESCKNTVHHCPRCHILIGIHHPW